MPEPGPGQVLIKVLAVTTCPHWDMHILGGVPMFPGGEIQYPYAPGQPGHEACAEVVALGEGSEGFEVGQRVCVWRDPGHDRPGCYGQYVAKDTEDLIAVPEDRSPEAWAPLELAMCVSAHVMFAETLDALAGKRVAVFGLGAAGLACVQLVRAAGAKEVIAVDPIPDRRRMAREMGVDRVVDPGADDLDRFPKRLSPGSIDTSFDCAGHPSAVPKAMDLSSHLVVLFAVQREPYTFAPHHWGQLILAGARPHTREAAEYARERILRGQLDLSCLVSRSLPLEQYAEGVEMLRKQEAIKIAFLPQQT